MMQFISKGLSSEIYLLDKIVYKICKNQKKYKKELSILESIQIIPMVIRLINYDNDKNIINLEYLPYTLEDLIIKKSLSVLNKLKILKQIAEFIILSKKVGIVHNDLKAKNILVDYNMSTIKICDFDISKWSNDNANDIKKFKFLIIQLMYDIKYETSYKQYKKYANMIGSIILSDDIIFIYKNLYRLF
jgi:serine/threonine protein kinase